VRFTDFAKWKLVYDERFPARQKVGLKEVHLLRNTENPNEVILLSSASCCFTLASKVLLVRLAALDVEIAFATIKSNEAGAEPAAYPRYSAR
jgi:hypothetical protein